MYYNKILQWKRSFQDRIISTIRRYRCAWGFLFLWGLSLNVFSQEIKVSNLLCENQSNPIGLDIVHPALSWQLEGNKRGIIQSAYEIRVSNDSSSLIRGNNLVWRSEKIMSGQSVHVPYSGSLLKSGAKYYWQVKVWDNHGNSSKWSMPAYWQMGLLNASDWKAHWISRLPNGTSESPCPQFRNGFKVSKKIKSATVYVTSKGLYEAFINGRRVGEAHLTPGWTSYKKRLQYQVFDVTPLIKTGANAIGVMLGNGWYKSPLGWGSVFNTEIKDRTLALLFQLEITYSDGSTDLIVSDENWKSSTGFIMKSEIYAGEVQDARQEKKGWLLPDYDDKDWNHVVAAAEENSAVIATYNELVKEHEIFKPLKMFRTNEGDLIVDFGQNMTGYEEIKVYGKAGDTIVVSHAEILDPEGNFYTKNLRTAKAESRYILSGEGEETLKPHFTFYGFRYLRIEGISGDAAPENFSAISLYSDMKPTGSFSCSNPLINKLQQNIQWGQKSNFLDVPTDCPQRDERLGWTGDAQVFCSTAAFNMHVYNFFAKWLKDLSIDQFKNGSVPYVIPHVLDSVSSGSTGWADVATIIPWQMYLSYGDKRILEAQYPSMKRWVDYMKNRSKNDLWATGFHIGDWLYFIPEGDYDGRAAVTNKYLIAQCFYAHSTQLLINAARALEKDSDVEYYSNLLKRIKTAFAAEYITPNGNLVSGTQTAYLLALNFDMLPAQCVPVIVNKLIDNINDYGIHLTTGFVGTPYLCPVLTRYGHSDMAYKLMLQDTYPSWLYPVKLGATTIWEKWDGIKPDGSFQNPGMNSFNHYAYGAIGNWMYSTIAGINTDTIVPGYKKVIIKPQIGGNLTFASASLKTYYGEIKSGWKITSNQLVMDVEIPANTTATIYIPATNIDRITESKQGLMNRKDMTVVGQQGDYVIVILGSGKYSYTVNSN